MRRILGAVRPNDGRVASCDVHLPLAMDRVVNPTNGDTHLTVRRVETGGPACEYGPPVHPAWWVLTPRAVIA